MKYLRPASPERRLSRLKAAATYSGKLCSSTAIYSDMRSFAETIASIPRVAKVSSTGYSKRSILSRPRALPVIARVSAAPARTRPFMNAV